MERQRNAQGARTVEETLTASAGDVPLMGLSKRKWAAEYKRWYKQTHDQTEPPSVMPANFGASEAHIGYNFGPEQAAHILEVVKAVTEKVGGGLTVEVASSSTSKRITASTRPIDLIEKASPFTNGVKVTVKVDGIDDVDKRAKASWVIANALGDPRIDRGLGGPAADIGRRSPEMAQMLGMLA